MDINKVLLDSPETLAGLKYLADFKKKYNLIPNGSSTDMMNGIFYNNNLMYCLNGPWMLGELKKKISLMTFFPFRRSRMAGDPGLS